MSSVCPHGFPPLLPSPRVHAKGWRVRDASFEGHSPLVKTGARWGAPAPAFALRALKIRNWDTGTRLSTSWAMPWELEGAVLVSWWDPPGVGRGGRRTWGKSGVGWESTLSVPSCCSSWAICPLNVTPMTSSTSQATVGDARPASSPFWSQYFRSASRTHSPFVHAAGRVWDSTAGVWRRSGRPAACDHSVTAPGAGGATWEEAESTSGLRARALEKEILCSLESWTKMRCA